VKGGQGPGLSRRRDGKYGGVKSTTHECKLENNPESTLTEKNPSGKGSRV
jgi:hypothetical protein